MTSQDDRFEQLYRQHYQRIVAYLRRFFPDGEDARDVAQNVFKRVFEHMGAYGAPDSDEAMLKKIAGRLALNEVRRRHTQKRDAKLVPIEAAGNLSSQTPSPENTLVEKEKILRIAGAIEQLPPRWRQCVLHRYAGLSYKEIAAVLDTSVDSVKACLYEARSRLAELLEEEPEGLDP